MTLRTLLTIIGCFVFCLFVQFLGLLGGIIWAVVAAIGTAALFILLLGFFEVELPLFWLAVALPVASSAAGIGLGFLGLTTDLNMLWVPLLSGILAALWLTVRRRNARRCALCPRRLPPSEVAFECPRCVLLVCEQCWDFQHLRCRLCEQNHVPIFSPDARWWDRQLGARSNRGQCQVCMQSAADADLRGCRGCGRPQCRDCWDSMNGQCQRCGWIIPDLPERLRAYMLGPHQEQTSHTRN